MSEHWLPVVGYEGLYEVSSWGRVRSVARTVVASNGVPRRIRERLLKLTPHGPMNYLTANFYRNGKSESMNVQTVVARAFLGEPEPGHEVRHFPDSDPSNNRLTNLVYGTRGENIADQVTHGTHACANKTHCPDGHEYTLENTYIYRGRRNCRKCRRDRQRRYRERYKTA